MHKESNNISNWKYVCKTHFLFKTEKKKADGRIWKGRLEISILMARSCSDWNKQSFAIDFNESKVKSVIRSGEKLL